MRITKIKLNSDKKLTCKVNGVTHYCFKVGNVPKRFAMTVDEIMAISHIPGIKKYPISSWLNYKGYVLISSEDLNGRDTMHTIW